MARGDLSAGFRAGGDDFGRPAGGRVKACLIPFLPFVALLLSLAARGAAPAENLLANSSFELGDAGTLCVRLQDPAANKDLVYDAPEIDRTTAAHGKASLRIANRFGDAVKLHFREVELAPDTEYTFSIWLKSDADDFKVRCNALSISQPFDVPGAPQDWYAKGASFQPEKGWKRFSCTFPSGPAPHRFYDVYLEFRSAGTLWIDAAQLSKGELAPYEPRAPVEIAIATDRDLYAVPQPPVPVQVGVHAVNYSGMPQSVAVQLVARDDYTGEETRLPGFAMDVPPGSDSAKSVPWALSRFGAFTVDAEGGPGCGVIPACVASVGRYEAKPLDLDKTFCVSVNDSAGGLRINAKDGRVFSASGASVETLYPLLGEMGCRLLRMNSAGNSPFFWSFLEPSRGTYDFGFCDRFVDLCAKGHIEVLPNIGAFQLAVTPNHYDSIPEWLIPLSREDKEGYASWLKQRVLLPPQDLWRRYVEAVTGHYKGRITHYEVMNEPLFWMTPENYIAYLKTVYPVIEANGGRTVGFCASTDFGANAYPWMAKAAKLGALDFCDAVSFHPYDSRQISSDRPADLEIESLRDAMASYGKPGMPLWNTEVYYLNKAPHDTPAAMDAKACDVATRFLTDLGEGVAQSSCIPGTRVFRKWTLPHLLSEDFAAEDKPSAVFVAYNALARHFEGAKPLGKFRWASDSICYAFERGDGLSAAFWHYGDSPGPKLQTTSLDKEAVLYDLFGNVLPRDGHSLPLGGDPFYLKLPGPITAEKRAAFLAMLQKAQVETEIPLAIQGARLVPENGWTVLCALKNLEGGSVSGSLGVAGGGLVALQAVELRLDPSQETVVSIPVKLKPDAASSAVVRASLNGGKIVEFPLGTVSVPKTYSVSRDKAPLSPLGDGGSAFSCRCDDRFLHVAVTVRDATPSGAANGRPPWAQDGVELFFDVDAERIPGKGADLYTDKTFHLFINPYLAPASRLSSPSGALDLSRIPVEAQISREGYTVDVSIPLDLLGLAPPLHGRAVGFDLQVDDVAAAGAPPARLFWNSQGTAFKDRLSFGFLTFP